MAFRALRVVAVRRARFPQVINNSHFAYVTSRSFFNIFKAVPTAEQIIQQAESKPIMINEIGEKVVYESSQRHQIRLMVGCGVLNSLYWSYHLVNAFKYHGVVIDGIEMGGDPMWGYMGLGLSALITITTREFARHAVYKAYVSPDGFRLGFQMHNLLGSLGRKIEAKPTSITVGEGSKSRENLLPLHIQGVDKNVLVDMRGDFYGSNVLQSMITDQKIPDFLKIDGMTIKSTQLINAPVVSSLLGDTETSPSGVLVAPLVVAANGQPVETVQTNTAADSAVPLNSIQASKVSRRPPNKFRGQNGKR